MALTVPAGLHAVAEELTGVVPSRVWRPTSGALLARCGDLVVKVHPPGTDRDDLVERLRTASSRALLGVLAAPRRAVPAVVPARVLDTDDGDRLATVWPLLEVLDTDVVTPPWQPAATTLALLHRTPVPDGVTLPPQGAPQRLLRALDRLARLAGDPAADAVLRAGRQAAQEVDDTPARAAGLVHGDWHLGQLGRDTEGRWLLLDLDDLGLGDPAWDLGRAAGFWAAGLLDDATWATFLDSYRDAEGPAVPADEDPWPRLDLPARAEVVVAAARAVQYAADDLEPWDDTAEALVAACARMSPA